MKYFKFNKLIRDKILPNMLANNQKALGIRKLNDEEFVSELIKKVVEEAKEMKNASNKQELKEELADVYEVLNYIKKALNLSDEDLAELIKKKSMKNGKFDERTFVESVGAEEGTEWFDYYKSNPEKYPEINESPN